MGRGDRRKCKCCLKLFRPDPRNRHHQYYCSASGCRAASKAASQARWRAKPENQSYFCGPVNVARVQAWGRVESGVGYVKKNFLHGIELTDLRTIQAAAQVWWDVLAVCGSLVRPGVLEEGLGKQRGIFSVKGG